MNLNLERYLRVNLLGLGPRLMTRIYGAAVSQRLRKTVLWNGNQDLSAGGIKVSA